jgi:molybdopterin-guanine dinucleotide biosynthesis protein A
MNFSAVILAGGKSSRMGRDKAWLDVGGRSLLARQVELAGTLGAREVFVSGRADVDYTALGYQVLLDRFPGAGPLAGIEAALAAATSPLVLVLAVDMPHMSVDVLRQLVGQCAETTGAIPRVAGEIEPLAAVYPKSALPLVTELLSKSVAADVRRLTLDDQPDGASSRRLLPEQEVRRAVKSPSARAFAECCVAAGLARFVEFPADQARAFANWNSPADVAAND